MENKEEIKQENRLEIWQGNEITQARYNFTAMEINLMCLIFSKVRQINGDYLQYQFTFDEFCDKTGLNKSNIFQLKKAIKMIQTKPIEFYGKNNEWYSVPLISGVKIDSRAGVVTFNIDIFIKPLISEIVKNTTRYFLDTIFALDSKHAKRLYTFFSMYKNSGKFVTTDADLKNRLLEDDKYESFSMFMKKVITPAIDEINEVSELSVKFDFNKKYGCAANFNFYIKPKKTEFKTEAENKVYELLKRDGMVEWFINNTMKTLTPEQIYKLHYDTQIHAKRNKGAYLRKLLIGAGVPETKI